MISFVKKHWQFVSLSLYFFYLLVLIFRSSFVLNHVRYFSLFDDEMVSMRYAHNLASGFGLVWNPGGARVEGVTNPLWVSYMTFFHLLHIPLPDISFFIQLTGAVCMVGTVVLVHKLTRALSSSEFILKNLKGSNNNTISFLAAFFTATYFPLINWNVIQGTEGSLLTLLLMCLVYQTLLKPKFSFLVYLFLGLGFLTRMDFMVPTLIIWFYVIITQKEDRRKNLLIGGTILGVFILTLLGMRIWYYHDLLPNTYYLKLTGYPVLLRIIRGVYVNFQAINPLVVVIAAVPLIMKRNKELMLFASLIIGQFVYSVYVGGDAWEFYGGTNRYTTIVMPGFFILLALGLGILWEMFVSYMRRSPIRSGMTTKKRGAAIAFVVIVFISLNAISDNTFLQMFLIKAPITTPDNAYNTYVAKTLEKITTKDATIAVAWAGVIPYFADRNFIDLLGKNDRKIAHEVAKDPCVGEGDLRKLLCFKPGHMKWDYGYTIGELQPDIVMQAYPIEAAQPYLNGNYMYDGKLLDMYIRMNDNKVMMLPLY